MKGVVACVAYAAGRRVGDVALEDISEVLKQPDRFVWIGLLEPDQELLGIVQEEFSLHDLAIEDAHRAHQRPKLEMYDGSLFVVMHTVQTAEGHALAFGETHLFVGPNYIVSVRHGASPPFGEVRARCESQPTLLAKGPGFVLYALMDFIVDHYFPAVDVIEDQLEEIEEAIFGSARGVTRETTGRIYHLKRELLHLKRATSPLIDITNRLMRFDVGLVPEDTRPYFRDVYDHVVRVNEMTDMLRELLTSALEANLSLVSVRQNDDMKRLAGWAAIVAVPTMIAGVYGMNFELMPELKWRWGYPLVMGGMIALCLFLYARFKRSGWL